MKIQTMFFNALFVALGLFLLAAPQSEAFGQAGEKITFECPRDVRVGFKDAPADWEQGFGGGVGLSAPFSGVGVFDGKPPVITCIYGGETWGKAMFSLTRIVPVGYRCAADGKNDKNRFVVCTRIKPPIKLQKKN